MPPSQPSEPVASFPPALATAAAEVLVQADIPAWVVPHDDEEHEVQVPAGLREEALRVIALHMEAVSQRAGGPPPPGTLPVQHDQEQSDAAADASPLMMERIRNIGIVVAVVLAPLLAITLASPPLPRRWSLAVYAAGVWLLLWWRARRA